MPEGDWLQEFVPQAAKRAPTILDATNIQPRPAGSPMPASEMAAEPLSRGLAPLGMVALAGLAGFVMGRMLDR